MTNYEETPEYMSGENQDLQNVDASRILRDITFVRLNLESIYMNEEDEFIEEVIVRRSLFGFVLEYQFPSLDAASTSLKTKVRINAKSFNGNAIHFRHKRVVRIKMIPELANLWRRSSLLLAVYAKLNTLGKYSMKKLGSCQVPLEELVVPPFIICRDFLFVGPGFSGSALLKIDLGSHIRLLMERLEMMRNGILPRDGSATRARSRSLCKKKSIRASSRLATSPPLRRAFSSSPPRVSRIAEQVEFFSTYLLRPAPLPPLNIGSRSPSISPLPSPRPTNVSRPAIRELCPKSPSYRVRLTVYSARRLPMSFDSRGHAVAPSTYVTVIGEDGRTLSSPVRAGTLHPEWNWTETFNVSRSRQNLVAKLWKRCIVGPDKVIGFVSLQLPPVGGEKSEYEMSNLSVSDQAPLITLSISREPSPYSGPNDDTSLLLSSSPQPPELTFPVSSPRLQNMTRQEVFEKLKKNIAELEQMMARMKR